MSMGAGQRKRVHVASCHSPDVTHLVCDRPEPPCYGPVWPVVWGPGVKSPRLPDWTPSFIKSLGSLGNSSQDYDPQWSTDACHPIQVAGRSPINDKSFSRWSLAHRFPSFPDSSGSDFCWKGLNSGSRPDPGLSSWAGGASPRTRIPMALRDTLGRTRCRPIGPPCRAAIPEHRCPTIQRGPAWCGCFKAPVRRSDVAWNAELPLRVPFRVWSQCFGEAV
jgi:hypothetical protein